VAAGGKLAATVLAAGKRAPATALAAALAALDDHVDMVKDVPELHDHRRH
jgi:hypothetical protein